MAVNMNCGATPIGHSAPPVGQAASAHTSKITLSLNATATIDQLLPLLHVHTKRSWQVIHHVSNGQSAGIQCILSEESTKSYLEMFEFYIYLSNPPDLSMDERLERSLKKCRNHDLPKVMNSHKIIIFQGNSYMGQLRYTCHGSKLLNVDLWTPIFNACEFAL